MPFYFTVKIYIETRKNRWFEMFGSSIIYKVYDFPATKVSTRDLPLLIPEIKIGHAIVKQFSRTHYRKYMLSESNLLRTPSSVCKENVSFYYTMKMWNS